MRRVTHRTTLPQRGVLENKRPGLLAVTLRARLVSARHRQAAGRLQNVAAMRVMTLRAAHVLFDKRMMLRQMKLCFGLAMTLETR